MPKSKSMPKSKPHTAQGKSSPDDITRVKALAAKLSRARDSEALRKGVEALLHAHKEAERGRAAKDRRARAKARSDLFVEQTRDEQRAIMRRVRTTLEMVKESQDRAEREGTDMSQRMRLIVKLQLEEAEEGLAHATDLDAQCIQERERLARWVRQNE
jgi:hypothetical protein